MRTRHMLIRALVVISVTLGIPGLTATTAHAATCTVPGTHPTITAAGTDPSCTTIKLGKGPFYENVVVDHAVTIVGKGGECGEKPQSIIDASPLGLDATGTHVQADNVTVKDLVIRHGSAGIEVDANNFKATNLCIFGQRGGGTVPRTDAAGIRVNGNDSVIKSSEFHSSDGGGVQLLTGNGATVARNISRNQGANCFYANISNVTFRNNKAVDCDDRGFVADFVSNLTVEGNVISDVDDGIQANQNANPTIRDNRVRHTSDGGIFVSCVGTCTSAAITGNTVAHANRDGHGFQFFATAPGGTIADNVSIHSGGSGFYLGVDGWTIANNLAVASGKRESNTRSGFELDDADGNELTNNVARDGRDDGFQLRNTSDGNTLTANRAVNNVKDGFDLKDGTDNILDANKAIGNRAEGIENDGTTTDLTNNVAKGNRWDCNWFDGTEDVVSGNACADGLDPNALPPQGQVD